MTTPDSNFFAERLRAARREQGYSQEEMAEFAGVSRRNYGLWELGRRSPSATRLQRLAEALNISSDWLIGAENQSDKTNIRQPTLPLLGLAECSLGDWYINSGPMDVRLPCPADMATDPEAFAVMATGTSLQPEGVRRGFLCLCSPALAPQPGDIVYIQERGGHASLKVYLGMAGGKIRLKGYLPLDENGAQASYTDERPRANIRKIAPVVYVKRKL